MRVSVFLFILFFLISCGKHEEEGVPSYARSVEKEILSFLCDEIATQDGSVEYVSKYGERDEKFPDVYYLKSTISGDADTDLEAGIDEAYAATVFFETIVPAGLENHVVSNGRDLVFNLDGCSVTLCHDCPEQNQAEGEVARISVSTGDKFNAVYIFIHPDSWKWNGGLSSIGLGEIYEQEYEGECHNFVCVKVFSSDADKGILLALDYGIYNGQRPFCLAASYEAFRRLTVLGKYFPSKFRNAVYEEQAIPLEALAPGAELMCYLGSSGLVGDLTAGSAYVQSRNKYFPQIAGVQVFDTEGSKVLFDCYFGLYGDPTQVPEYGKVFETFSYDFDYNGINNLPGSWTLVSW